MSSPSSEPNCCPAAFLLLAMCRGYCSFCAGETSTGMLLGIQIPPATEDAFAAAVNELKDTYSFDELSEEALQVFPDVHSIAYEQTV